MKIILLDKNPAVYSCNYYLIYNELGNNFGTTLIDVGTNEFILNALGKEFGNIDNIKIDQVILTHSHFDHAGGLPFILQNWKPKVYAYTPIVGVTNKIEDTLKLSVAGYQAELFHTPGHTHDSICIYFPIQKILFSGDTTLDIRSTVGSYHKSYLSVLEYINSLEIDEIYGGHGEIIRDDIKPMLEKTIQNIKNSTIFG